MIAKRCRHRPVKSRRACSSTPVMPFFANMPSAISYADNGFSAMRSTSIVDRNTVPRVNHGLGFRRRTAKSWGRLRSILRKSLASLRSAQEGLLSCPVCHRTACSCDGRLYGPDCHRNAAKFVSFGTRANIPVTATDAGIKRYSNRPVCSTRSQEPLS